MEVGVNRNRVNGGASVVECTNLVVYCLSHTLSFRISDYSISNDCDWDYKVFCNKQLQNVRHFFM